MSSDEVAVSIETLQKAVRLVDLAKQFMAVSEGDQFAATFKRSDGKLAGRVAYDAKTGEFIVDFSLHGLG